MAEVPAGAVVTGVDDSTGADRAAHWAAAAALREHRALVLARGACTAARHTDPETGLRALEDDLVELGRDLVARTAVELGEPGRTTEVLATCTTGRPEGLLVDLSREAHLVVVGSRGLGRVRAAVEGSVSGTLMRQSRCPVVVVRPSPPQQGGRHGIVVGVSGAETSGATAELAFRMASWTGEALTVAHCFWEAEGQSGHALAGPPHADLAAERLAVAEVLAGLRERYPDVAVRVVLERGDVEYVLGDLAGDATLVVVGAPAHSALSDVLPGSVASVLLGQPGCPVVLVPHRVVVGDDRR